MAGLIDSYSLRARVAPALLVILPLFIAAGSWLSHIGTLPTLPLGALFGLVIVTLLSQLGRDLGKRKEPALFAAWGGPPTTLLLSYSHSTLNPQTLDRIHRVLQARSPVVGIPTDLAQELQSPDGAAQLYESVTEWLRERTRDRNAFPLVFEENVSYGFRRNLWAMKVSGVACSVAGIGITSARALYSIARNEPGAPLAFGGGSVCLAFLVVWVLVVRPVWVRSAAQNYAERLLASLDSLG